MCLSTGAVKHAYVGMLWSFQAAPAWRSCGSEHPRHPVPIPSSFKCQQSLLLEDCCLAPGCTQCKVLYLQCDCIPSQTRPAGATQAEEALAPPSWVFLPRVPMVLKKKKNLKWIQDSTTSCHILFCFLFSCPTIFYLGVCQEYGLKMFFQVEVLPKSG